MNSIRTRVGGEFIAGMVATVVLLVVGRIGVAAWNYFQGRAIIETIIHLVTMPVFSVVDVLTALLWLVMLYVVGYMLAFGPRVN